MRRRDFFKIMGIASGAAITACKANNADRKIIPYLVPPEDGIIPGIPRYIKSTCTECPANCGLDIKIRDDKPVKLEGNVAHPINKGALCIRGQAGIARLYSPDRLTEPMKRGKDGKLTAISWETAIDSFKQALQETKSNGKEALLLHGLSTGSLHSLMDSFCKETGIERFPEIELFNHNSIKAAYRNVLGLDLIPHYEFEKADVVITIGADIFETFLSPVEWMQQSSESRKNKTITWFHLEPHTTLTGSSADYRITVVPGSEPYLLGYLLNNLTQRKPLPKEVLEKIPIIGVEEVLQKTEIKKEILEQLLSKLDKSKQPLLISGGVSLTGKNGSITATYTALIQYMLDMMGNTVNFDHAFNNEKLGTDDKIIELQKKLKENRVGLGLFSGVHLFNTLPYLLESVKEVKFKIVIAEVGGPLTDIADLILPLSDPLESWGDTEPRKGLKCLIQPAIEPIKNTYGEGDIFLGLMGKPLSKTLYRDFISENMEGLKEDWINKGFIETTVPTQTITISSALTIPKVQEVYNAQGIFMVPSLRTYDGRSSDILLLNEIPDPLTAVSYDKYLAVSMQTAKEKDLTAGDVVELKTENARITLPVMIATPLKGKISMLGVDAMDGLELPLIQGESHFNFYFESIEINKLPVNRRVAVLSGGQKATGRGILPLHDEHESDHKRYTLYPPHTHKDYRWAMAIDLDACTGCSACVAACYIENNIPIVGRAELLRGREMAWLRIEPYMDDPEKPEFLPMMCQQCDNAPCETVCPVYATFHNPEGLNAQVYNRCVGTRYCANNCPYKARRFNWFDREENQPLNKVSNPDLSVRPKGVMEKCSFCIQRIRFAKDRAKDEGRLVKDGEMIPACAQTCPAKAITFGNIMDPESKISQLAKTEGSYRVMEQLGTEPAVYYIKRKKHESS